MEETLMTKAILELGVTGGIAFYLLIRTTNAVNKLADSVSELAKHIGKIDALDTRIALMEQKLESRK